MAQNLKKNAFLPSRYYRKLQALVILNIFLLVVNLISYIFVTDPGILRGRAAEVSFNMRICPAVGSCVEATYYRFQNNECTAVSLIPSEVTANDYTTLAECETHIVAPTPTPTPTPTAVSTAVPGYAPPGLVAAPYKEEDIFKSTEEGFSPFIKIIQISGEEVIQGVPTQIYNREPEFVGVTNLKSATIFLQYDYEPKKVYLAFANSDGVFIFYMPQYLDIGSHSLFLSAVSPYNPYFRAETLFTFEILPIKPSLAPTITPSPSPHEIPTPTIAPVPSVSLYPLPKSKDIANLDVLEPRSNKKFPAYKPIAITDQTYSIYVGITEDSKQIYPGEAVRFNTRISRLSPSAASEDIIPVHYFITDPNGKIIFDRTEQLLIRSSINTLSQLSTSFSAMKGKYELYAEIPSEGLTYISTDTFAIVEPQYAVFPGLTISQSAVGRVLLRMIWAFSLILLLFLSLLYGEYKKCKLAPKISEKDLYKDKDVV